MKILLTCIGRRVELVQAFRAAAEAQNIPLLMYGTDAKESAPALLFCDNVKKVCAIRDKLYIPSLLDICRDEGIDCVIPTIDTDLLLLAEHQGEFADIGTRVLISAPDKIAICRDKNYTADYLLSLGLLSPKSVNRVERYEGGFPAFIKPKDGSSSINAYKVASEADLAAYAQKIGDYIIQRFIDGEEYTIDVFCDFLGNPIYITPRKRLEVRAGEVLKTSIAQDRKIIDEIMILVKDFKPCGPITVQMIREKDSGEDYYIEINPRFGGGAPLSIKAGADSPAALLRLLCGEAMSYLPNAAEDGAIYSRFDQSIRIRCHD